MTEIKILGNQDERNTIDNLVRRAGQDSLIKGVLEGETFIKKSSSGEIIGLEEVADTARGGSLHTIHDIAFSSDNRLLFTAGEWISRYVFHENAERKSFFENLICDPHRNIARLADGSHIYAYVIALSSDGRYLAAGYSKTEKDNGNKEDYHIGIFDTRNSTELCSLPLGGIPYKVMFSPNDRHVLTRRDNTLEIFNFDKNQPSLELNGTIPSIWDFDIAVCSYLSQNSFIAVSKIGSSKQRSSVKYYLLQENGKILEDAELGFEGTVYKVQFSKDGKHLALANNDPDKLRIFESSLLFTSKKPVDYNGNISDIDFDPCSDTIAVAFPGSDFILLKIFSGFGDKIRASDKYPGVEFFKVMFSKNGRYIAAASTDYHTRIFEVKRKNEPD